VGDALTILIYENAIASNSAQNGSRKNSRLTGQISAGSSLDESAQIGLSGNFDGTSQTGRAGKMVAQISVTVDALLPNGDLHVSGEQTLKINGERTNIKLRGRVRQADISANNAILSTRLADAAIDYDGTGFVSRGAKPGIVTRIFSFLGLL
jgi:flagellar L-ring protein precursor FlgH